MDVNSNEELAAWTKRLLNGMPLRTAEARTGVSYMTVANLLAGKKVGAETVIRFAAGFGEDIPAALRIARFDDVATLWEAGAMPVTIKPDPFVIELNDLANCVAEDDRQEVLDFMRFKIARARRKPAEE